MIAKLRGVIDTLGDGFLVIDVNGVGYQVACSQKTLSMFPALGESITLFIETVMRQESLQLYGFYSENEKDWFRLLTTVQGVGMKVALAILSVLTPNDIHVAIASQDKTLLTRADGVGGKLAARIVNELKEKSLGASGISATGGSSVAQVSPAYEEARLALTQLGYKQAQVSEVLRQIQDAATETLEVTDLIRAALAKLSRAVA
ncbi:MAG: Holliday junction branch migration protein RuvA [Pseudomonadota bacterium]